jgi:hypothetical protein
MNDSKPSGGFASALNTLVSSSAAPYGYTISVWSSGAVLMHFRGPPNVGDVFAFAAGALAGFTLIGLFVHSRLGTMNEPHSSKDRTLAGVLHWFAIGVTLGAVALIAEIPSWVAWPLAMFAATTIYLLGASVQLAVVSRMSAR